MRSRGNVLGEDLRGRPRPVATALAAGLLAVVAMTGVLAWEVSRGGLGLSTLVTAGTEFVDESRTPSELRLYEGIVGYDGQQYYRLSRHPFATEPVVEGIPLDDGAYRQQRILYPLAAWALAAATGASTLVTLPLVNLLAVGALGALAADWARRMGSSPWWGVLVALAPPLYFGASRDLAEPLALALMVGGVSVWSRRPWAGSALLCCAVLARETSLVAAAGLGVAALVDAWRTRSTRPLVREALPALAPLGVFVAWQAVLSAWWGATPATRGTADRAGPPLVAVLRTLFSSTGIGAPDAQELLWGVERVLLLVALGIGVWLLRHTRAPLGVRIGYVLALLVAVVPSGGWAWAAQFTRAAGEAIVLGALVALGSGARGRAYAWPLLMIMALVPQTG